MVDTALCWSDDCYSFDLYSANTTSQWYNSVSFATESGEQLWSSDNIGSAGNEYNEAISAFGCIYGCMDEMATNYDENANQGDQAELCIYPCDDNEVIFNTDLGYYIGETSWNITACDGTVLLEGNGVDSPNGSTAVSYTHLTLPTKA